jgi:probable phosphoglycerate mutase
MKTCELAGFGSARIVKPDLAEWDYGAYEGLTTKEILAGRPGWRLFHDGCPQGEMALDAGARADAIIHAMREADGNILIFSSSHFLRVLAARWLGLPPEDGALFILDTASISVLGYEHDRTEPVIRGWNRR